MENDERSNEQNSITDNLISLFNESVGRMINHKSKTIEEAVFKNDSKIRKGLFKTAYLWNSSQEFSFNYDIKMAKGVADFQIDITNETKGESGSVVFDEANANMLMSFKGRSLSVGFNPDESISFNDRTFETPKLLCEELLKSPIWSGGSKEFAAVGIEVVQMLYKDLGEESKSFGKMLGNELLAVIDPFDKKEIDSAKNQILVYLAITTIIIFLYCALIYCILNALD